VDCWRFFPDSGIALSKWAQFNGIHTILLESYIEADGFWGDFTSVFLKDRSFESRYPKRIMDCRKGFINGRQESLGDSIIHSPEVDLNPASSPFKVFVRATKNLLPKKLQEMIWKYGPK
jgi:hypothetical protein